MSAAEREEDARTLKLIGAEAFKALPRGRDTRATNPGILPTATKGNDDDRL